MLGNDIEKESSRLLKVREVRESFKLSKFALYELIKSDLSFPVVRLGPVKNYRIPENLFIEWLNEKLRHRHQASFKIPTADDLLKLKPMKK